MLATKKNIELTRRNNSLQQVMLYVEKLQEVTRVWSITYDKELFECCSEAVEALAFLITGTEECYDLEYSPTNVSEYGWTGNNNALSHLINMRDNLLSKAKLNLVQASEALASIPELVNLDLNNLTDNESISQLSALQVQIAKLRSLNLALDMLSEIYGDYDEMSSIVNNVCDVNAKMGKELRIQNRELYTLLKDEYGDIMTAKDIADFFKCNIRTVTNWEAAGYICRLEQNLNEEFTCQGKRKRSAERHFLTKDIASSDFLKERFKMQS